MPPSSSLGSPWLQPQTHRDFDIERAIDLMITLRLRRHPAFAGHHGSLPGASNGNTYAGSTKPEAKITRQRVTTSEESGRRESCYFDVYRRMSSHHICTRSTDDMGMACRSNQKTKTRSFQETSGPGTQRRTPRNRPATLCESATQRFDMGEAGKVCN
jgi:hypothetical protein